MEWWQTLAVALSTYAVTKFIDYWISILNEKRDFKKLRRVKELEEIEDLKDELGCYYELASNLETYEMKAEKYNEMMTNDDYLVGKYNKYPKIAKLARATIHLCKRVASDEKVSVPNAEKSKKELSEKFREFIKVCNDHLENSA